MSVTEPQVRAAFQVVSQASSVEQANELLGSELAPLFNQGASGEGFSEFEAPAGDPLQISLAFPKVSFETIVSGVAAGTYGSSTQVPVVTVDKYGRVLDVTLADIGEAGPTGPASGDLSGTYPAPTVSGLSGHALPALGATSGSLRWTGASWVVDSAAYAPYLHSHDYLPIANPTYTGRLTGPTQYLEANEQILLAIRRPGGNSGRIHGVAFQAQNDASAWAEFGRVMTYISSVAAGAHTGGMRLMAYKAGAIVQALDAGPDGVTFAGLLSGPRATLTEFGTLAEMPGNSNYATLHATGVTRTGTNYALRLADDGTNTLVNASSDVALAIAGTAKVAVTASEMNLASGVALKMAATTVIDSSRNITGTSLKATGLAAATVRPATIGTDGLLGAQDAATFRGTIGAAKAPAKADISASATIGSIDATAIKVTATDVNLTLSGGVNGQGWDIVCPTTSFGISIPTGVTLYAYAGSDIGPTTRAVGGGRGIRIVRIDAATWIAPNLTW